MGIEKFLGVDRVRTGGGLVEKNTLVATSLTDFCDQVRAQPGKKSIEARPTATIREQTARPAPSSTHLRYYTHGESLAPALVHYTEQRNKHNPHALYTQQWATEYRARTGGKVVHWVEEYGDQSAVTGTGEDIVVANKGGFMEKQCVITALHHLRWMKNQRILADMQVHINGVLVPIDDERCQELWKNMGSKSGLYVFS